MSVKKTKALLLKSYLFENDYNTINKSVIIGLINSIIAPIYNSKDETSIVYRILNKDIKNHFDKNHSPRFKFLNAKKYNPEDENLETTEFLIISSKQYSACIMYDFSIEKTSESAVFCTFFNSKKIDEILKILLPDEKFSPERRENQGLNEAILNLIKFSENSFNELSINEAEKNNLETQNQNLIRNEFLAKKSRYISHEIKNHLSIIDVYNRIIEKTEKDNPTINNATKIIFNSIQNVVKLLQSLKNFGEVDLNLYDLNFVINETIDGLKEMAISNNIKITVDLREKVNVVIDKDKFQNVILNLVKNAVEALKENNKSKKLIEITSKIDNDKVSLFIMNNGEKISKEHQQKIFEEGYTTKQEGSGLGLYICRQNLKDQLCELSLLKSTPAMTVFEIKINAVN